MAKIFQCPIHDPKVAEDFKVVKAYNKARSITMTADYRAFLASKAKKIRRMPQ